MTDENRRENALNEAALGDDASKAARALVDLGLPNDAVSRAYYAAFHYGRAVLLCHGLEPKPHRGVLALLERSAGEAGWLSRDAVTRLAHLQTFRSVADYDARVRISLERAREEVAASETFIAEARSIV
ncbi:MAG TPA: HEPN domain-containing protein [Polyangiaceae bacterium]|nr:HEPN domain-containing protein [Polyangiaceae bacterium]